MTYNYELEDRHQRDYDSDYYWTRRYHNVRKMEVEKILSLLLATNEESMFLDVGSGVGIYLNFAQKYTQKLVGVDISKSYIKHARKFVDAEFIKADAHNLPFKDETFDIVLCSEVIEHLLNYQKCINELQRVSRKFIILTTPNQGIWRRIYGRFRSSKLKVLDKSVGHTTILPLHALIEQTSQKNWVVAFAKTEFVVPPMFKGPIMLETFVRFIEVVQNVFLPAYGNISFLLLKRDSKRR